MRYTMKPITPGEILMEDYMKPLDLSQNRLGRELGVSPRAINEIVHGRRSITAEMSIRLGAFFSQSPRFWINIQTECDLRKALRKRTGLVRDIQPLKAVAESSGKCG
jgi:addiction module HigA family antidote